jgi:hypothetical protein
MGFLGASASGLLKVSFSEHRSLEKLFSPRGKVEDIHFFSWEGIESKAPKQSSCTAVPRPGLSRSQYTAETSTLGHFFEIYTVRTDTREP